jgi:hypothetical protein
MSWGNFQNLKYVFKMGKVFIKNRLRRKYQFQFYMHQFVEQCIDYGFIAKNEYYLLEPYHIKGLFIRLAKLFFKNNIRNRNKKRNAIIVTANGSTLFRESFPYFYSYEIIPMLWDVWPGKWDILYKDTELSQVNIHSSCGIKFIHSI